MKKKPPSLAACLQTIASFARLMRTDKVRSPRQILDDSGYAEHFQEITQEKIARLVRNDPKIIDEWVQFSEDKRWSPAWAFGKQTRARWEVAYKVPSGQATYRVAFQDAVTACAFMIRMEMEELRVNAKA